MYQSSLLSPGPAILPDVSLDCLAGYNIEGSYTTGSRDYDIMGHGGLGAEIRGLS